MGRGPPGLNRNRVARPATQQGTAWRGTGSGAPGGSRSREGRVRPRQLLAVYQEHSWQGQVGNDAPGAEHTQVEADPGMNAPTDLVADPNTLRSRLRQQRLVATFGSEALRAGDFDDLLQEAARLVAEGLGVDFAKVLEYIPREDALLIRAGVGWRDGVVGVLKLGADTASPAGFALKTGQPVISNHLADEPRFRTPAIMAEHGVRRAVNVIVRGEGDGPAFGVLEADTRDASESFSPDDVAFLQAIANVLGLAVDRERDRAARDLLMREVHHRVKNSLQIAQTVLLLQARAAQAEAARDQLEEACAPRPDHRRRARAPVWRPGGRPRRGRRLPRRAGGRHPRRDRRRGLRPRRPARPRAGGPGGGVGRRPRDDARPGRDRARHQRAEIRRGRRGGPLPAGRRHRSRHPGRGG
jgi:GAF domain-containing protein